MNRTLFVLQVCILMFFCGKGYGQFAKSEKLTETDVIVKHMTVIVGDTLTKYSSLCVNVQIVIKGKILKLFSKKHNVGNIGFLEIAEKGNKEGVIQNININVLLYKSLYSNEEHLVNYKNRFLFNHFTIKMDYLIKDIRPDYSSYYVICGDLKRRLDLPSISGKKSYVNY